MPGRLLRRCSWLVVCFSIVVHVMGCQGGVLQLRSQAALSRVFLGRKAVAKIHAKKLETLFLLLEMGEEIELPESARLPRYQGLPEQYSLRLFYYKKRRMAVTIRNLSNEPQDFTTRGLYFTPASYGSKLPQRMGTVGVFDVLEGDKVIPEQVKVRIEAGQMVRLLLWVACFDPQRPSPSDYHGYSIANHRLPREVQLKVARGVQAILKRSKDGRAVMRQQRTSETHTQQNRRVQRREERRSRVQQTLRERQRLVVKRKLQKIEEVVAVVRCSGAWVQLREERADDRDKARAFLQTFIKRVDLNLPHLRVIPGVNLKRILRKLRRRGQQGGVLRGLFGVIRDVTRRTQRKKRKKRRQQTFRPYW